MAEVITAITDILAISLTTGGASPVTFTLGGLAISGVLIAMGVNFAKKLGLRR